MHYEFDIVETTHAADDIPDRPHREGPWHPFTTVLEAQTRAGWELVDVDVHVIATRNKYDRPQKIRTVISVWRRPVEAPAPTQGEAGAQG
jgi:hypothetical protein